MLDFSNLLVPPLLFFIMGLVAKILRSDLHFSNDFIKYLGFYLMIGIGINGGIELKQLDLQNSLQAVIVALFIATIEPLIAYQILRKIGKLNQANSAAISAHYGSVSVGTFLAAIAFLDSKNISYEPYPIIMLAVMESPAIIIGLLLAKSIQKHHPSKSNNKIADILSHSLTNGSIILLLGSMIIGYLIDHKTVATILPFYEEMFKGVLSLFVLALGAEAGMQIREFLKLSKFLLIFGVTMPVIGGLIGVIAAVKVLSFSVGGSVLVGVLAASASYIAVPPVMRREIPQANPAIYLTLTLGITFPFNVIVGIPLYLQLAKFFTNLP